MWNRDGWFSDLSIILSRSASMNRFFKSLKNSTGLFKTSFINWVSKTESRKWHCLTMLMEVTSDTAMDLKTWVLSEVDFPLHTRIRNDSLLQRTLAHMVGQFSTSNGAVLDENLGSFSTRHLSYAWKDSSACNREQFSTQFSDPYSKTGSMQLSTMLRDDRGLGGLERHLIDHWKKMQHKLSESALWYMHDLR